jgi:hypothetical protein
MDVFTASLRWYDPQRRDRLALAHKKPQIEGTFGRSIWRHGRLNEIPAFARMTNNEDD